MSGEVVMLFDEFWFLIVNLDPDLDRISIFEFRSILFSLQFSKLTVKIFSQIS